MNLAQIKKISIPTTPGCYQYLNSKKEIIYVGKAANLKSRIFSYWHTSANHSLMKQKMMQEIKEVKIIECDSEMEALLLEANLIKKIQPYYNILLRDDKRYSYIKISTEEEWPRIFQTRTIDNSGRYFGPFTSGEAVKIILKTLQDIWPYRSCRALPKKPCLYFHINRCPGMCANHTTPDKYKKTVNKIISFLNGEQKKIIKSYESKIKKQKSGDNFEKLNRELFLIKKILEETKLLSKMDKFSADVVELAKILGLKKIPKRIEGYDIAHIFGRDIVGSMVVFENGEPNKNEYRKFKIKEAQDEINDTKMLKEILTRRFNHDWAPPDLILVDGGKGQLNAIISILNKLKLGTLAISISKGKGLRSAAAPDRLYFPGQSQPLELNLNSPALHILKRIRDESHRFAIEYHRKIRGKRILQ
ncbi:excinuclease ABC subunit UvrC [Patescibacteria group bacterium]|nr:excinuclease ABC subunit UvrC [Patescibacteria group bacterium]